MDLSKEWLEAIFKKEAMEKSISKVVGFETASAVGKAENFFSDMTRVKVDVILGSGKKVKKSILVKQIPQTEIRNAMIKDLGAYHHEIMIYRDIFPLMEDVLSEMDNREDVLWGKCIEFRPYDRLVLEDLNESGYKMANKLAGLDLVHCKLALNNLAKFHAISLVLKERNLISLDSLEYNIFYKNNKNKSEKLNNDILTKIVEMSGKIYGPEWKPLFEKLGKRVIGNVPKTFSAGNRRDDSKFAVIIHGDFWTNNMLFKYTDDGAPISVKFVDYQMSFYQSPAQDLQWFFATSPSLSVRESHLDELVVHYHQCLEKYMKKFNCSTEIPSLSYMQEEFERFAPFGLAVAIFILPYMSVDKPDEFQDLEEMTKGMTEMEETGLQEEPLPSVYFNSKTYHEKFKIILKNAEKKGTI